jgi:hypothetical protein
MCISYNQIIYSMFVLVNYYMDTFFGLFGIGYRSEHIYGGYPCTVGYVLYTERGGGDMYLHYLGYAW